MKKCAFIVHLRDLGDIAQVLPLIPNSIITKILRRPILWLLWRLRGRMGFMVRDSFPIKIKGKEVRGYILVIWLTGKQMSDPKGNGRIRKRILEAVLYAQNKLKCDVVGLGALTASVTSAGEWLVEQPGVKTVITHGDSYAVALALEGIDKIADKIDLNLKDAVVAIVGATGIIGEALSLVLASKVAKLILEGRRLTKLNQVAERVRWLGGIAETTIQLNEISKADIVVTATSAPGALISPDHLKNGAVVLEVSQPRNTEKERFAPCKKKLVVDGSYASVPKEINFWWMSLPSHTAFGCMVETMLTALKDMRINRVGDVLPDFVKEVSDWAKEYGFRLAPLTSFNEPIKEEEFHNLKSPKQLKVVNI